ncbi:unnamed protein product [Somion occarium]|uniref:Uncharacterized protein n=1 Tax=Somion occarium TaxID=3059160 RepID=A0ABP1D647_9APHY
MAYSINSSSSSEPHVSVLKKRPYSTQPMLLLIMYLLHRSVTHRVVSSIRLRRTSKFSPPNTICSAYFLERLLIVHATSVLLKRLVVNERFSLQDASTYFGHNPCT